MNNTMIIWKIIKTSSREIINVKSRTMPLEQTYCLLRIGSSLKTNKDPVINLLNLVVL